MDPAQHSSVDTFRLLVEQSPFGIYIVNSDFRLVQVSRGAEKVFSQVRPLLGRDFAEVLRVIWPEPFASEAIGHFRHTLATGEPYHAPRTVEQRRDIDATEAYDWKIERLVLPDGRFGAVCHFYDLSDRIAAENAVRASAEALRQSEARLAASAAELDALYQNAPAGLCVVDPQLRYVRINERLAQLNGVPISQALGRYVGEVTPEWPEFAERFRDVFTTGNSYRGEISGSTAAHPETVRSWLVSFEPVRGPDGVIAAVSATAIETTEQRAAERRLEAAQRMETAGRIAGGVAHEANNQMTIVLGAASFLLDGRGLDEDQREDLEQITRAAERTAAICQQLLAFSRRQVLHREELAPDDVTRALSTLLGRTLGDRSRLTFALGATSALVRTDRGQLEQAILNLALNARDAMPNGGTLTLGSSMVTLTPAETRRLGVTVEPGRYWQLFVQDTGTGMDAATRTRIFEPFFTTKPVGLGTGLGLSMVQGVLRQSGGDIVVESEPGDGTTVRLFLPVVGERGLPAGAAGKGTRPAGAGEVLLVDDEPTLLRYVDRTLRAAGFGVQTAASGDLAMRLLGDREAAPTCLVTDVMMPGLSGVDLAERVRQRWPSIPVLLMSGHVEVGPELLVGPRTAFLPKPFTPSELVRCVTSLVSNRC